MTIPDLGSDLVGVAIRTAIVYIVLVIFFRFVGKREAGQLSTLDLVVLLVISNAVQNAMVGENVTLIGGLLAAAVILFLDWSLHRLNDRFPRLREVVEGEPVLVVRDGQILEDNLASEGLSVRELGIALRQNGLLTADEARFVYLETNGQISVIPRRDNEDESGDLAFDPDDPDAAMVGDPGTDGVAAPSTPPAGTAVRNVDLGAGPSARRPSRARRPRPGSASRSSIRWRRRNARIRLNASRRFSGLSQPWPSSSYQWTSWYFPSISSASTIFSDIRGTTRRSFRPWRIRSGASIRSAR